MRNYFLNKGEVKKKQNKGERERFIMELKDFDSRNIKANKLLSW